MYNKFLVGLHPMIVVMGEAETDDAGVVLTKSTESFASEKQCFAGDVCQTKQCPDELGFCVLRELKEVFR